MRPRTAHTVLFAGLLLALAGAVFALRSDDTSARVYPNRVFVPAVASDKPLPAPTPTPVIDHGPVAAVFITSIGIDNRWPIELLDTVIVNGQEQFANPNDPRAIAYYPGFGTPGRPGGNSIYAAHVNFYTGVTTPFARVYDARPGDDVWLEMEDGTWFRYTLLTIETIPLTALDQGSMTDIVYPQLPPNRERVTFISCGGDFIPNPSGIGGSYDSRIILTAERIIE